MISGKKVKTIVISFVIIFFSLTLVFGLYRWSLLQDSVNTKRMYWGTLISTVGPRNAYKFFELINTFTPVTNQHTNMHVFGEILYQKEGIEAIRICDDKFSFGCYHSVFGLAITKNGVKIISKLDKVCEQSYEKNAVGCQHGIGHGLLEYYGPSRLNQALKECERLRKYNPYLGCSSGVFMEYNLPLVYVGNIAYTKFRKVDRSHPYFPCESIVSFRTVCFHKLPQLWEKNYMGNFSLIGTLCDKVSNFENRIACYYGIGGMVALASNYDVAKTKENCGKLSNKLSFKICMTQAYWGFYNVPQYKHLSSLICPKTAAFKNECAG